MTTEVSEFKRWERFHRPVLVVIAVATIVSACALVVIPLVVGAAMPGVYLLPSFLGMPVPARAQPVLVVLLGLILMVEGVFLFYFHPVGFWLAAATGVAGLVHGLVSLRGSFLPVLVNLLLLLYLYHVRGIFLWRRTPPEAGPQPRAPQG